MYIWTNLVRIRSTIKYTQLHMLNWWSCSKRMMLNSNGLCVSDLSLYIDCWILHLVDVIVTVASNVFICISFIRWNTIVCSMCDVRLSIAIAHRKLYTNVLAVRATDTNWSCLYTWTHEHAFSSLSFIYIRTRSTEWQIQTHRHRHTHHINDKQFQKPPHSHQIHTDQ